MFGGYSESVRRFRFMKKTILFLFALPIVAALMWHWTVGVQPTAAQTIPADRNFLRRRSSVDLTS